MSVDVEVRKARLSDAQEIANFVNRAHPGAELSRLSVAERFSQVGFVLAETEGELVGLVGFQVENLVIRVTDFLLAPQIDRQAVGDAMIATMELSGTELQAEASMLFLPPEPSAELLAYWKGFGYIHHQVQDLQHRAWRDAAKEWAPDADAVVLKQLREELTRKPM